MSADPVFAVVVVERTTSLRYSISGRSDRADEHIMRAGDVVQLLKEDKSVVLFVRVSDADDGLALVYEHEIEALP